MTYFEIKSMCSLAGKKNPKYDNREVLTVALISNFGQSNGKTLIWSKVE